MSENVCCPYTRTPIWLNRKIFVHSSVSYRTLYIEVTYFLILSIEYCCGGEPKLLFSFVAFSFVYEGVCVCLYWFYVPERFSLCCDIQ